MDWLDFLKLIIGAGIGSALVQGLLPLLRDLFQRKKQATYMAMRLAVTLENFAWACANLIQDNHNAQTLADEEYPEWDVSLPVLPPYPDDDDGWRSLDRKLAGRCLVFRNRLQESDSIIRTTIDLLDGEDTKIAIDEAAAKRGLEAWDIAVALRQKHRIEDDKPEWNYVELLKLTAVAAEKAQDKRRKSIGGFFAQK